jgi:hypothetical protein
VLLYLYLSVCILIFLLKKKRLIVKLLLRSIHTLKQCTSIAHPERQAFSYSPKNKISSDEPASPHPRKTKRSGISQTTPLSKCQAMNQHHSIQSPKVRHYLKNSMIQHEKQCTSIALSKVGAYPKPRQNYENLTVSLSFLPVRASTINTLPARDGNCVLGRTRASWPVTIHEWTRLPVIAILVVVPDSSTHVEG